MIMIRVLHVDDESDIRELAEISLGLDPDFVTRSCASGQEALAVAEEWLPHLILLDVMMPVMDGPTALARLRENPKTAGIPVVFMTARTQSRDLFRSLGAVGVILKPFDALTLGTSVRAHVNRPDVDARFGALRDTFLLRVDSDAAALARQWSALKAGISVPTALARIRDIAHGLAGAGGAFGFSEIGDAAAALEEAVLLEGAGWGSVGEIVSALGRVLACAEAKTKQRKTA